MLWNGDGIGDYWLSLGVMNGAALVADSAGAENGWIASDFIVSMLHGTQPSPEDAPLRGAQHVYLIWRWLLWLAGISGLGAYFAGWLPWAALIKLDLMAIGALMTGRLAYEIRVRQAMRDSLSRRLEVSAVPERRVSAVTLTGVGILAVSTTILSNIVGDSVANRPLLWLLVIAVALSILEPVADLLFESRVDSRFEP